MRLQAPHSCLEAIPSSAPARGTVISNPVCPTCRKTYWSNKIRRLYVDQYTGENEPEQQLTREQAVDELELLDRLLRDWDEDEDELPPDIVAEIEAWVSVRASENTPVVQRLTSLLRKYKKVRKRGKQDRHEARRLRDRLERHDARHQQEAEMATGVERSLQEQIIELRWCVAIVYGAPRIRTDTSRIAKSQSTRRKCIACRSRLRSGSTLPRLPLQSSINLVNRPSPDPTPSLHYRRLSSHEHSAILLLCDLCPPLLLGQHLLYPYTRPCLLPLHHPQRTRPLSTRTITLCLHRQSPFLSISTEASHLRRCMPFQLVDMGTRQVRLRAIPPTRLRAIPQIRLLLAEVRGRHQTIRRVKRQEVYVLSRRRVPIQQASPPGAIQQARRQAGTQQAKLRTQ